MKCPEIKWLEEPETHNYPAAFSYLSLTYNEAITKKLVDQLKKAGITGFKAQKTGTK